MRIAVSAYGTESAQLGFGAFELTILTDLIVAFVFIFHLAFLLETAL